MKPPDVKILGADGMPLRTAPEPRKQDVLKMEIQKALRSGAFFFLQKHGAKALGYAFANS